MNTAQLVRQSLYDLNAVLQNFTTDPFYRLPAMLAWATQGKNKVEKQLRLAKEDFNLLLLQSNDAAYRWCGITYDPATLTMATGTRRYPLPPDLLMLKSLRALEDESVVFREWGVSRDGFEPTDSTGGPSSVILYRVVGENTLLLGNDPPGGLGVEVAYIPRSGPLQIYSTGTVSVVNGDATVSGAGTLWVVDELRNNLELILGTVGAAPKILSTAIGGTWVDPSIQYLPVGRITNDTELELAGPWLGAGAAGLGYILATVPPLPEEHHQAIIDHISMKGLRSGRSSAQDTFRTAFKEELAEMKGDVEPRQEQSVQFIEEWNP